MNSDASCAVSNRNNWTCDSKWANVRGAIERREREDVKVKVVRASNNGLTIVCVFNDAAVLDECLSRSVRDYRGPHAVDLISLDNTDGKYPTAGAALNAGSRLARYETVVFAHQDVYLHSIDRIFDVADRFLGSAGWSMLGANGMSSTGRSIGQMRDRILLIGTTAETPAPVDSLDEVLFMATRTQILEHPLAEEPHLAWHAYAVEYSARLRASGKKVGAVDLAVTHNSLSTNMALLDEAHRFVGSLYPDLAPIQTTCGSIRAVDSKPKTRRFSNHRRRARWALESFRSLNLRKWISRTEPIIVGDISHDVDDLTFSNTEPLLVINVDHRGGFAKWAPDRLEIARGGRAVLFRAVEDFEEAKAEWWHAISGNRRVLVTDVDGGDIRSMAACLKKEHMIVGVQPGVVWVLTGPDASQPPNAWIARITPMAGSPKLAARKN